MKSKTTSSTSVLAPSSAPLLPGFAGFVGIDVAKNGADYCFLSPFDPTPRKATFSSRQDDLRKMLRWLKRLGQGQPLHICLEETGCYGRKLAHFLHRAGHYVSLVHAGQIKSYGACLNMRTKTDAADAWLIARYAMDRAPKAWKPLEPQHQALRELVRRRQQLVSARTQERNQLEAAQQAIPAVKADIKDSIQRLTQKIKALEKLMAQAVKADPGLTRSARLLISITGIAALSAHLLLGELPPLEGFESARQLCAYAGLTPRQNQSGTHQGRSRMCKQGRPSLRAILFMPALSILRTKRGPLGEFADRLLAQGKSRLSVAGALMRKLMGLVFAVLRTGVPFDPSYPGAAAKS